MVKEATMTSKGQITIPKVIRERLGLEAGRKVGFILRGREVVLVRRSENPLKDLRTMRREVSFGEDEIKSMISRSKETWSKFQ
jgi:AbrB family looped-hinge helix DNA binding protein